jgi:hypothetical protein
MRHVQAIVSTLCGLGVYTGLFCKLRQKRRLTSVGDSIREFCELGTPILMFDKDGAFAVATLKEVRFQFGHAEQGRDMANDT